MTNSCASPATCRVSLYTNEDWRIRQLPDKKRICHRLNPVDPRCRAAVCAYPTGLHNGNLGAEPDAGTLARLSEMRAELLLVFGDVDPHVPATARSVIRSALQASGARHVYLELPGEHAFMRDEGARYDPEMG